MFAPAQRSLARSGTIVHATSEKLVFERQIQFAILDTGGTDRSLGDDLGAVRKVDRAAARSELAANTFTKKQYFRSKADCLFSSALSQLCATDPRGKAEIVFDLRTGACLTAQGEPFHEDRF